MKRRAAPSVDEIEALAVKVNGICMRGCIASAAEEVMHQIYTAVPGAPGAGLQIFEAALHPQVGARTAESGAWMFQLRGSEEEGAAPHGSDLVAMAASAPRPEAHHNG